MGERHFGEEFPLAFTRVVFDACRGVKDHGVPVGQGVGVPVWQTGMIGVAIACHADEGAGQFIRHAGIHAAGGDARAIIDA